MKIFTFLFIILFIILLIFEILLRIYEKRRNILLRDSNYPFYRFKPNQYKYSDYIDKKGKNKTPKIKIYSEGIRSDIQNEKRDIVLMLGCSNTLSLDLIDSETSSGYLQKLINSKKYAVINAGMAGYGIFQILHLFKSLLKYKPKIVIAQLMDFRRYPFDEEKLRKAKKTIMFGRKLKKMSMVMWRPYNVFSKFSGMEAYMFRNASNEELWKLNIKYLNELVELCKKNNIKLVMYESPTYPFFSNKIKKYAKRKEIFSFDVNKIWSYYCRPGELDNKCDGHLSALANKLIAKSAYNCLLRNKLL